MSLKELAQQVCDEIEKDIDKSMSPIVVEIIVLVLAEVVRALATKYLKPEDALAEMKSQTPEYQAWLEGVVSRHLADRKVYQFLAKRITKAVLRIGSTLSISRLTALFAEVM